MSILNKLKQKIQDLFSMLWRLMLSVLIVVYSHVNINPISSYQHNIRHANKQYSSSYEHKHRTGKIDSSVTADQSVFTMPNTKSQIIYTNIQTKQKDIIQPKQTWLGTLQEQKIRLLFNKNTRLVIQDGAKIHVIKYKPVLDSKYQFGELIINYKKSDKNPEQLECIIKIKLASGAHEYIEMITLKNNTTDLETENLKHIQTHSYLGISNILQMILDLCGKVQNNWWMLLYPSLLLLCGSYFIYKQALLKRAINKTAEITKNINNHEHRIQEMQNTIQDNSNYSNTLIALIPSFIHMYYITRYFHLSYAYYNKGFSWIQSFGLVDQLSLLPSVLQKISPIVVTPTVLISVLWGSWFIQQDKLLSNGNYHNYSMLDYLPLFFFYYSWAVHYPSGSIYLSIIFTFMWHATTNILAELI